MTDKVKSVCVTTKTERGGREWFIDDHSCYHTHIHSHSHTACFSLSNVCDRTHTQCSLITMHAWRAALGSVELLCRGQLCDAALRPVVAAVIQQPMFISRYLSPLLSIYPYPHSLCFPHSLPLTHSHSLSYSSSILFSPFLSAVHPRSLYLLLPPRLPWWQLCAAEITLIGELDRRSISFIHEHTRRHVGSHMHTHTRQM